MQGLEDTELADDVVRTLLDDVRSMYKAVNGLLIQNSILPKIRYGVALRHSVRVVADLSGRASRVIRPEVSSAGWAFTLRLNQFERKQEYCFVLLAAPPTQNIGRFKSVYRPQWPALHYTEVR